MNIISKKSLVTSFVFAGLVLSSVSVMADPGDNGNAGQPAPQAAPKPSFPDFKNLTKKQMLVLFGLASVLVTVCKKAVPNPEKVSADDIKKLAELSKISTQEYWDNVYHIINDGYFGQVGARGKSIRGMTSEEDGSVTFREESPLESTGVCGRGLAFVELIGKKFKKIAEFVAMPALAIKLWKDSENAANGEFPAPKPETAK